MARPTPSGKGAEATSHRRGDSPHPSKSSALGGPRPRGLRLRWRCPSRCGGGRRPGARGLARPPSPQRGASAALHLHHAVQVGSYSAGQQHSAEGGATGAVLWKRRPASGASHPWHPLEQVLGRAAWQEFPCRALTPPGTLHGARSPVLAPLACDVRRCWRQVGSRREEDSRLSRRLGPGQFAQPAVGAAAALPCPGSAAAARLPRR